MIYLIAAGEDPSFTSVLMNRMGSLLGQITKSGNDGIGRIEYSMLTSTFMVGNFSRFGFHCRACYTKIGIRKLKSFLFNHCFLTCLQQCLENLQNRRTSHRIAKHCRT